jgi:SNF2 family DNA or RNA helicase
MDRSGDWSEMGLGKSLVALAKGAHLIAKGLVSKILIVCPKSVVPVWEEQIEKHTYLSYQALTGPIQDKAKQLLEKPDKDIYIISYDSIPGRGGTKNVLVNALLHKGFEMVIEDEITQIKNFNTLRFKYVRMFSDTIKYLMHLTGTPITNHPESIFSIYLAMDKGETFGTNLYKFRNKYFRNVGAIFPKWEIRENRKDELSHKMYIRAIRSTKEECLDLPPKIFTPRYCELEEGQETAYKLAADELVKYLIVNESKINVSSTMAKMQKLSQICSGFIYNSKGVAEYIGRSKAELLRDVLDELEDKKAIIYTRWKEDIHIVEEILAGFPAKKWVKIEGSTIDRKTPVRQFQKGDAQYLVSQIRVGRFGITATAASHIIYFSLSYSVEDWLQSQDRIHRDGQVNTCVYIPLLVRNSIDEHIYRGLEKGVEVAKSIVDSDVRRQLIENLRQ